MLPQESELRATEFPPVKDHWFRESTNFTRFVMKSWQPICHLAPISLKAVLLLYFLGNFFDFILQRFSHSYIFKLFFFFCCLYSFLNDLIFVSSLKQLVSLRIYISTFRVSFAQYSLFPAVFLSALLPVAHVSLCWRAEDTESDCKPQGNEWGLSSTSFIKAWSDWVAT